MVRRVLRYTIDRVRKDGFLGASLIYFIGTFSIGVLNYFYQFLMVRMLTIEDFGGLQSLLAFFTVVGVLFSSATMIVAKYTADFRAKGRFGKIHTLSSSFTNKGLLVSAILTMSFLILSGRLSRFLNLTSSLPLMIFVIGLLFGLFNSVQLGILQGLQEFKKISVISATTSLIKIVCAVAFIRLGWALNGAVGAVVFSNSIFCLFSFYPLMRFLSKHEKERIEIKEVFHYSLPAFFALLFVTALINSDIILVKHFFSARTAGEYGALSTLTRIITFMAAPIIGVMFSMAADAHGRVGNPASILKKAALLVVAVGSSILFLYFFLADLMIKILVGGKFLAIDGYLGWAALSMFLYSLINLATSYFLSVGKVKCVYSVGAGVLLQIVLISFFHADLWQIIWIMNITMVFVLSLLTAPFLLKLPASCSFKPGRLTAEVSELPQPYIETT